MVAFPFVGALKLDRYVRLRIFFLFPCSLVNHTVTLPASAEDGGRWTLDIVRQHRRFLLPGQRRAEEGNLTWPMQLVSAPLLLPDRSVATVT